jgi:hypothetical protein
MDEAEDDYAMRVVQARCPEIADQVIEIDILEEVLGVIAEMQDRIAALEAAVGIDQKAA